MLPQNSSDTSAHSDRSLSALLPICVVPTRSVAAAFSTHDRISFAIFSSTPSIVAHTRPERRFAACLSGVSEALLFSHSLTTAQLSLLACRATSRSAAVATAAAAAVLAAALAAATLAPSTTLATTAAAAAGAWLLACSSATRVSAGLVRTNVTFNLRASESKPAMMVTTAFAKLTC